MAKNFDGASLLEDDYAFEEADDPRTWFPNRGVVMECDEQRSPKEDARYIQYLEEEADEYFAKELKTKAKSRKKSSDVIIKGGQIKRVAKQKNHSPLGKDGTPWWTDY